MGSYEQLDMCLNRVENTVCVWTQSLADIAEKEGELELQLFSGRVSRSVQKKQVIKTNQPDVEQATNEPVWILHCFENLLLKIDFPNKPITRKFEFELPACSVLVF